MGDRSSDEVSSVVDLESWDHHHSNHRTVMAMLILDEEGYHHALEFLSQVVEMQKACQRGRIDVCLREILE
jgi:hypothetical protein